MNNYVLATDDVSVFFGGEARDVEPLRAYRAAHDAVDVAMLPVNGLHVAITGPQIVMDSDESVEGARVLGARTFIPIHDAYGHDLALGVHPPRGFGRGRRARLDQRRRGGGVPAHRRRVEPVAC